MSKPLPVKSSLLGPIGIGDDIENGEVEMTDKWLRWGKPGEVARPEFSAEVKLGGWTQTLTLSDGRSHVRWIPEEVVIGVPHETAALAYQVNTCNTNG